MYVCVCVCVRACVHACVCVWERDIHTDKQLTLTKLYFKSKKVCKQDRKVSMMELKSSKAFPISTCSQIHTQIEHSLAHLPRFNPYFSRYKNISNTHQSKLYRLNLEDALQNALFMHAFGYINTSSNQWWLVCDS